MTISILGCGWFGLPLAELLISRGHDVNGSTTTVEKQTILRYKHITPFLIDLSRSKLHHLASSPFFDCDVLVITVPAKKMEEDPNMIETLAGLLRSLRIVRIVFTSSTSVYGENNHNVDEGSDPCPTKPIGRILLDAENLLSSIEGSDTICLRFGGLVGPGRFPGHFFRSSKPIPNGLAPVNLIHLDDCLAITVQLIEGNYGKTIINAVCPHHPTRATFYTMAARAVGQPVPNFIPEKDSWKIVKSKYLTSLLNYEFRIKSWFVWLVREPRE